MTWPVSPFNACVVQDFGDKIIGEAKRPGNFIYRESARCQLDQALAGGKVEIWRAVRSAHNPCPLKMRRDGSSVNSELTRERIG